MNSISSLFNAPYNKKRPLFALFRFAYWKVIRLFKLNDIKYTVWNGRVITLHYNSFQSMWLMYNYIVDWEEFNLISKYVQSGAVVLDIGANMGLYTVWMAQFIGQGKIHAFEPDTVNYERLQKSIALNNLQTHVVANKMAASDIDGEISFSQGLDIENHIVHQITENAVAIQSQQLDSYAQHHQISSIAYLKIDVEGFEYAVLKGANNLLLNKQIDIIQLEINTSVNNSGRCTADVLELLNHYTYTLCSYDVRLNQLKTAVFSVERENYFAVNDLEKINLKLKNATPEYNLYDTKK